MNTFYTALDRLDFWNFGLKSSRGSKLLSEWKFDRKILFFRQPLLVLTCRHPQSFIGCFEEEEDFMSVYNLTSHVYDLLKTGKGPAYLESWYFRDKTFNSGKFCYRVLQPHLAWNRQEVVFAIVHKKFMN